MSDLQALLQELSSEIGDELTDELGEDYEEDDYLLTKVRLGINVDHVATLRQARGTRYPDPVQIALKAQDAGADQITVHLREDRRHIQERDVHYLKDMLDIDLNLEMANTPEMIQFATNVQPTYCCLVPEKRAELTTEGGLDVVKHQQDIAEAVSQLQAQNIEVSLFIDPNEAQINAAFETGARIIELHTGEYAEAKNRAEKITTYNAILQASMFAHSIGLIVNAGHGLHYYNTAPIAQIPVIHELNIGHAIIAEAVFCGIDAAVRKMIKLLEEARTA